MDQRTATLVLLVALAIPLAALGWWLGNAFRNFTRPQYLVTRNAIHTFYSKVFWLIGPQVLGAVAGVFVAGWLALQIPKALVPDVPAQPQSTATVVEELERTPREPEPSGLVEEKPPEPSMMAAREAHADFQAAYQEGGMSLAVEKSEVCYNVLAEDRSWEVLDRCMAFDIAAGEADAGASSAMGVSRSPYFDTAARYERWVSAVGMLGGNARLVAPRAQVLGRQIDELAQVELAKPE